MTVKDLINILSNQNPDAEVTVTKKTWEKVHRGMKKVIMSMRRLILN